MIVDLYLRLGAYPPPLRTHVLETFFEAQTRVNIAYLLAFPDTPRLLESGVRYQREHRPEQWRDIPSILTLGHDDCEGLSCWRAAELRIRDGVRGAVVKLKRVRPGLLHAQVVDLDSGRIWDPSRALGMGSKRRRRKPKPSASKRPKPHERSRGRSQTSPTDPPQSHTRTRSSTARPRPRTTERQRP